MSRTGFASVCFLFLTVATRAQDHSQNPRDHLGTVHFATSCSEPAQNEFDRAVALLHSFEFSRAIAGFNAALKSDDTCAIAWWGIALSQWSNPFAVGIKEPDQLQTGRASVDHKQLRIYPVFTYPLARWCGPSESNHANDSP